MNEHATVVASAPAQERWDGKRRRVRAEEAQVGRRNDAMLEHSQKEVSVREMMARKMKWTPYADWAEFGQCL